MALGGMRFRAFLVPLAVSIVPISVLIWYGRVHIPQQEAYLNERNLRLLMTLAGKVKTKVDNFDSAVDHAIGSLTDKDCGPGDRRCIDHLGDLMQLFAPELQIVTMQTGTSVVGERSEIAKLALDDASDPPRIRIDRDEGRSLVYLGASLDPHSNGKPLQVVVRADIESVVKPFFEARNEFDAVLLVTHDGDVIAQRAPIGLGLSRVDQVQNAHGSAEFPMSIAGADYRLYIQPMPLSLLRAESATADHAARQPDLWFLCGLVRADRFRADSTSLSFATLLWFSAALSVVILAIPYVKLRVLSAHERLHASDAGWVTATTFAAIGLLAIGMLDVLVFGYAFPRRIDARLSAVADVMTRHLLDEVAAIDRQSEAFDRDLTGFVAGVSNDLAHDKRESPTVSITSREPQIRVACDPPNACATDVLDGLKPGDPKVPYPYFYLATWIARDGWQQVKRTPGQTMTPFLNIRTEQLAYVDDVQRAWLFGSGTDAVPVRGVSVLESPNTGEPLTVFWRVRGPGSQTSLSLATFSPIALDAPSLPSGVSFAVVDRNGLAMFHSDSTRSLQENFLKECEDNAELRAAITGGRRANLSAYYLGHLDRLHVRPITTLAPFGIPRWSLIVFQDAAIADTLNLETATVACLLFGLYGAILAAAWFVLQLVAPRRWTKWYWPAGGRAKVYRWIAIVNGVGVVVFTCVAPRLSPGAWLPCALALAVAAIVFTRQTIVRAGAGDVPRDFGISHPFFVARTVFLLIVSALPAIACFEAAYTFETRLLATSEHVQQAKDVAGRKDRIDRFVARFGLRDTTASRSFAADRQQLDWDSVHAPLWDVSIESPGTIDPLLAWMHRSYNDVAISLKTAASTDVMIAGAASATSAGSLLAIVAVLLAVCYAFEYVLVRPLFVLDAVPPIAPAPASTTPWHLIVIGPPGSGKSTQLAAAGSAVVIDIARMADDPVERKRAAPAAALAGTASWNAAPPSPQLDVAAATETGGWADRFDYSTLPSGGRIVLAIDHLDHRLEEPAFASETLRFLERVVHGCTAPIQLVCDRDPLACLQESDPRPKAADLDRWARILGSFEQRLVRVRDTHATESPDASASPYYQMLWHACTRDERLALCQLAHEGVINPQSQTVVQQLMRVGLVVRDPSPRIMTESFRRFVAFAASPDEVTAWERQGVAVPWGSIELAMMTVVAVLAGLLLVTQEQLVGAWIGFVPTLMPAAQRLWSLFAAAQTQLKGSAAL